MVDRSAITAMDVLLWLQSGDDTADVLHLSASSVSRKANSGAAALGLTLLRQNHRWQLFGHSPLLAMERQLLQDYRLSGHAPLRVDCCFETRPLLAATTAETPGRQKLLVPSQPQVWPQAAYELLEERVIDGYVAAVDPDLPGSCRPLIALPLLKLALRMLAAGDHPLRHSTSIALADRLAFPSPATAPAGAMPHRERLLRQVGLGRDPLPHGRDLIDLLRSQVLEASGLLAATSLAATALKGLRPLKAPLGLQTSLVLVVHRELAQHPRLTALAAQLTALYRDHLLQQGDIPLPI